MKVIILKKKSCQTEFHSTLKGLYAKNKVGLISGTQQWFNTRKSVTVMHHINRMKKKTLDHLNQYKARI